MPTGGRLSLADWLKRKAAAATLGASRNPRRFEHAGERVTSAVQRKGVWQEDQFFADGQKECGEEKQGVTPWKVRYWDDEGCLVDEGANHEGHLRTRFRLVDANTMEMSVSIVKDPPTGNAMVRRYSRDGDPLDGAVPRLPDQLPGGDGASAAPGAPGTTASFPLDRWSDGHFTEVASLHLGEWLSAWISIGGALSALGLLNTLLGTAARVAASSARLSVLPAFLAVEDAHGVPRRATLAISALLAGACALPFAQLVSISMLFYGATTAFEFSSRSWPSGTLRRPRRARTASPSQTPSSPPPPPSPSWAPLRPGHPPRPEGSADLLCGLVDPRDDHLLPRPRLRAARPPPGRAPAPPAAQAPARPRLALAAHPPPGSHLRTLALRRRRLPCGAGARSGRGHHGHRACRIRAAAPRCECRRVAEGRGARWCA